MAWRTLKENVPESWTEKKMESTLTIEFRNSSRITLAGADFADNLRGQSADMLLIDEFAYVANLEEMWQAALLPMLATSKGRCDLCNDSCRWWCF